MDIEKELMDEMAREIQLEIDRDILNHLMAEHYVQQGWSMVSLERFASREQAVDIVMWLDSNGFKDRVNYLKLGNTFLFERAEDATMFRLKWL